MFMGKFEHSLDTKNRLFIPAKFRQKHNNFVITSGLEGCLFLYPANSWKKISQKLENLPLTKVEARKFTRIFLAGAQDCVVDNEGRILIGKNLLNYAGIYKDIVIIGVIDRMEIWSKTRWEKFYKQNQPRFEELSAKLQNLGI